MTPQKEFIDNYLSDNGQDAMNLYEIMEAYAEKRVKEEKVKMLEQLLKHNHNLTKEKIQQTLFKLKGE